jgi:hypothetical protein
MKVRTLYLLDAVVSLLLALGFLLGPATLLKFFGLTTGKTELLLAQIIGAALVGFGVLAWFGKDLADPQASQGTVGSMLVFNIIGFIVSLLAVLSQVTRTGSAWLIVILFLAAAGGFAYFLFAGSRE